MAFGEGTRKRALATLERGCSLHGTPGYAEGLPTGLASVVQQARAGHGRPITAGIFLIGALLVSSLERNRKENHRYHGYHQLPLSHIGFEPTAGGGRARLDRFSSGWRTDASPGHMTLVGAA